MRRFAEVVFLKLWAKISLFFIVFQLGAQDIPVGTWRTHFSYRNAKILVKTQDKVFCASENGLFSIDLSEGSKRKLSKIDGLSDVGISAMEYDADMNLLVVGYRSGLTDFIFEDEIRSITEIADSNLDGNKQINDIALSPSVIYLATNLGIVAVTRNELEIRENFVQIGSGGKEVTVSEIRILGGQLFANTEDGLQSGSLSDNLLDFNNWTHYPATGSLDDLTVIENEIFALNSSDLYQLTGGSWTDTGVDLPSDSGKIFSSNGKLLSVSDQSIWQFSGAQFESIATVSVNFANDIVFAGSEYWIADSLLGLTSGDNTSLSPDGPLADQYSGLRVVEGDAYGFHTPDVETYNGTEKIDGYSLFSEGRWNIEEITDFRNISDVVVFQGIRYFSSIGDGLYNESNDQIINNIPSSHVEPDTLITALSARQNLWVSSYLNQHPVHRFDGENWTSFGNGNLSGNDFVELSVSETGILWARRSDGSAVVFDAGDATTLILSGLPGAALDIELSIEDDAWIATDDGPAAFSDASFILQNNDVILPSFDSRVLFEDETIYAIETDGGNRVWFATDRGLWIFDEDISEQVELFNIENSPIPSNKVLDLAYDGNTGEMFVLTDKGLVSYRSASSIGARAHSNVKIFPNPVTPEYTGLVGIEGLAGNVSVKITDINGNLVKEVNANGGSASWDLRNVNNTEVVTGIYLLFSSSTDGEETYVGKIAVVR